MLFDIGCDCGEVKTAESGNKQDSCGAKATEIAGSNSSDDID